MSAQQQIELLAAYIMENVPKAPTGEDGRAGDCATRVVPRANYPEIPDSSVRLLTEYRAAFAEIMSELGEPGPNYPQPLVNAYEIAERALEGTFRSEDEGL